MHLKRLLRNITALFVLTILLSVGVHAQSYTPMPESVENLTVTIGNVTLPLKGYVDGDYWDPEKSVMTKEECQLYGISRNYSIDLQGYTCVGFGRYVYTALFYKYPQNATIDTSLGYDNYYESYGYYNVIKKVTGKDSLSASEVSAETIKKLFSACQPGAIMRMKGHTMILMAIYSDGCVIYDANLTPNEVDVRKYTWAEFAAMLTSRSSGLEALQMPTYYPGYTYGTDETGYTLQLDRSTAGVYVMQYNDYVNVRNGPSYMADIVSKLYRGDPVRIIGTYNGWSAMEIDGVRYWVGSDYLEKAIEVNLDANGGTMTVSDFVLNIKEPEESTEEEDTEEEFPRAPEQEITTSYYTMITSPGKKLSTLPEPTKENRTFMGWFSGDTQYTAGSYLPYKSLTLKASWCVMGYEDVPDGIWYEDYIVAANLSGLISTDTHFNPERAATRAEFLTVMGRAYERAYGKTLTVSGNTPFTDVDASAYYMPYIEWAYEAGITNGTTATTFAPNDLVTREQMAAFLYRYAKYCGVVASWETQDRSYLTRFPDEYLIDEYARDPVSWCVKNGILQGDNTGMMNPDNSTRRCEMVKVFVCYQELLAKY